MMLVTYREGRAKRKLCKEASTCDRVWDCVKERTVVQEVLQCGAPQRF